MREYRLFTTTDMVNWTDHGAPLKTSDFSWSLGDASAGQCIERNGKFYFYMSTMNKNIRGVSIGVAVADSPYGPYKDALGKALITNNMTKAAHHSYDDLDPTVFIDDDGQAYLYWGNGVCYWVKLNDDMVSINGDITAYDKNDQAIFGKGFTEAPWVLISSASQSKEPVWFPGTWDNGDLDSCCNCSVSHRNPYTPAHAPPRWLCGTGGCCTKP